MSISDSGRVGLPLDRRRFLAGAATAMIYPYTLNNTFAAEKPWLLNSIRSDHNPWLAWWNRGGKAYAHSINNDDRYLLKQNEGDTKLAIRQIKDAISDYSGNIVVNFDAGSPMETQAVAEICNQSQVYFVTHFNKPPDLHPSTYNPYYVAHIWNDDFQFGRRTAEVLMEAIERRGSIVALEGRSIDRAARERYRGLQEVLQKNRRVQLLDHQDANWEASSAFDITRWLLARFGKRISGIWAANDSMAIGAIEALRTRSLAGALPVTGMDVEDDAIAALKAGEMTVSLIVDSFWCGGIGLALAYQASTGQLDPTALPFDRELSSVFHVVTKTNVDRFITYRESPKGLPKWENAYDPRNWDPLSIN
jgi:ribose transport system substrate-binding protein